MGTRNLTVVINEKGEKKVSQYGQWDGYPEGVGVSLLNFLKSDKLDKMKSNLSKVRFLDDEKDKIFIEDYDKNAPKWSNEPDNRTEEQKNWFGHFISRDLAGEVLVNIANYEKDAEILLSEFEDTEDSWIEYAYKIDLQENTFGVYFNINHEPLKVYSLDELPSKTVFLSELKEIIDKENEY